MHGAAFLGLLLATEAGLVLGPGCSQQVHPAIHTFSSALFAVHAEGPAQGSQRGTLGLIYIAQAHWNVEKGPEWGGVVQGKEIQWGEDGFQKLEGGILDLMK